MTVSPRLRNGSRLILAIALALLQSACTTIGGATIGGALQKQSLELARQIEESGMILDDPALTTYVTTIGERLVSKSDAPPEASFHFAVLDDDAPNAFAIPSGHVYVSRGLLVLLGEEDELAGVLGHEIGHVLEQHSLKRATGQLAFAPLRIVTRIGGGLVGLALPSVGGAVVASGELPAALTGARYGRGQENEADEIGQALAAQAGWDPSGLSRVMDALAREQSLRGEDPTQGSWFSTHPPSPDRAARIQDRSGALAIGNDSPIASTPRAFLARFDGLVVGEDARNGVFDDSEFLHPELGFALRFPAGDRWLKVNTDHAVAAVLESPASAAILQVVARGEDPLGVAMLFEPEIGSLDAPPRGESVNGLPTAYATGSAPGGWGREAIRASARWIALDGLVYRILCESTDEGHAAVEKEFEATSRSFRALTEADRARILERRLRIAIARQGETLAAVLERSGSDWNLAEAAAANGVEVDATFQAGDAVKVARLERYESEG